MQISQKEREKKNEKNSSYGKGSGYIGYKLLDIWRNYHNWATGSQERLKKEIKNE